MMAERGLTIDHSTIARWVLRYGPVLNQRIRSEIDVVRVLLLDDDRVVHAFDVAAKFKNFRFFGRGGAYTSGQRTVRARTVRFISYLKVTR
jgi:hypothetical protein